MEKGQGKEANLALKGVSCEPEPIRAVGRNGTCSNRGRGCEGWGERARRT